MQVTYLRTYTPPKTRLWRIAYKSCGEIYVIRRPYNSSRGAREAARARRRSYREATYVVEPDGSIYRYPDTRWLVAVLGVAVFAAVWLISR